MTFENVVLLFLALVFGFPGISEFAGKPQIGLVPAAGPAMLVTNVRARAFPKKG